ncbi:hypothetical protein GFN85_23405 [Salmonella enterica]|nr:hypothetical protein [Salmonella enterica]EEN9709509.1 hypothetical protein [Salmonella enterica]
MSGFRNIQIPIQIGRWSNWYDLQSYIGKNKYTIGFEFLDAGMHDVFKVEIRYMTPSGLKIVSTLGPGQYTIEGEGAGTDQIRLMSISAIFSNVMVTVPN